MQKKTLVTTLSGVLVGGMLLSGGLAFADSNSSAVSNLAGKVPFFGQVLKHRGGMAGNKMFFKAGGPMLSQEIMTQLVKDGVITQAKADEIKAFLPNKAGRQDLLSELVTNKIITQGQADAIKSKIREIAAQKQDQLRSGALKTLVEKGAITREQSDKILAQFDTVEKNREELARKMEDMTLREIRQYWQDNKDKPQDAISRLVADGVITQAQADAFHQAMKEAAQKKQQQLLADGLKTLVDKGTLKQEQVDAILKKIEDIQKDRTAELEKVKKMTPEERRQYKQDNMAKIKSQNPIDQLLADGTITRDQAKAIRQIMPRHQEFKGSRR